VGALLVEGPNRLKYFWKRTVSGSRALPPRWPSQGICIVIESSFDPGERLQAPGSLFNAYQFCKKKKGILIGYIAVTWDALPRYNDQQSI
jgi:hypothetical protein